MMRSQALFVLKSKGLNIYQKECLLSNLINYLKAKHKSNNQHKKFKIKFYQKFKNIFKVNKMKRDKKFFLKSNKNKLLVIWLMEKKANNKKKYQNNNHKISSKTCKNSNSNNNYKRKRNNY